MRSVGGASSLLRRAYTNREIEGRRSCGASVRNPDDLCKGICVVLPGDGIIVQLSILPNDRRMGWTL